MTAGTEELVQQGPGAAAAVSGLRMSTNFLPWTAASATSWGTTRTLRRQGQQRQRQQRMVLMTIFVLFACMSSSVVVVAGEEENNWIDPDTPDDARTTQPLNVKPPHFPPYKDDGGGGDGSSSSSKRNKKSRNAVPTPAPTPAPTTPEPTRSPTVTPTSYPTMTPRTFELVFSDEFETAGRPFQDGTDPRWTALDKNDYTNDALHYYSPNNVRTENGSLVITSMAADTDIVGFDDVQLKKTAVTKHFRSAMVQTWNKFCFTGGIVEARVTMPGEARVGGLWPAFWLLGNLARHTYVGSSEHIWPWSSSVCSRKAKNQQSQQKLSGCRRTAHYGMAAGVGRGAPEIDIFEAQPGNVRANTGPFLETTVGQPFASASFQVAPGRVANRPGPGYWPGPGQWYSGLQGGYNASLNILFYGTYNHFISSENPARDDYWSDAISYNRQLDESHFNSSHVYRLEWDVPSGNGSDGYLHWFLDGQLVLAMNGTGVKESGLGAEISTEPSYVLLNTAISKQWGFPLKCPADCPCENFNCHSSDWRDRCGFSEGFCAMIMGIKNNNASAPPEYPQYKIDYVRVYQDPDDEKQKVGCSTPERPTRRFIEAHEKLYKTEQDAHPLRSIQTGRGTCRRPGTGTATAAAAATAERVAIASNDQDNPILPSADNCGGPDRGRCTAGGVCECLPGWTGPHCLAHAGADPIVYDAPDSILDVGFVPPTAIPLTLLAVLVVLVVLLLAALKFRKCMEGWTPIPNVLENQPTTTAVFVKSR